MRTLIRNLGLPLLLGGLASLQLSCSDPGPTSAGEPPSFSHGQPHLTVSGPAEITSAVRQGYNYTAYMGASYPSFKPWGVRFCPTASITGCTVAWSTRYGTTQNTYWNVITQSLVRDCTGGGTKTFQARAQASAFATPTETAYVVTRLCPKIQP